jgi:aminoglycoside phosphotransferase (APT) family kinase protein
MAVPPAERPHSEKRKLTVSERSVAMLTAALQDWLDARPAGQRRPTVSGVRVPGNGGLSSTSVLFEACWPGEDGSGAARRGAYVARMAPEESAVPVFPRYDLPAQFEVISRVAARCDIPLPALRWNEPDGGALGTPFFVMDQVDGRIPLDNPPYVFTGWLLEATPEERAVLQRASVAVLVKVHAIPDAAAVFPMLRPPRTGRTHCGTMWTSNATTTAGRWPTTASGCRSSSGALTGWRNTGRTSPGPTS